MLTRFMTLMQRYKVSMKGKPSKRGRSDGWPSAKYFHAGNKEEG